MNISSCKISIFKKIPSTFTISPAHGTIHGVPNRPPLLGVDHLIITFFQFSECLYVLNVHRSYFLECCNFVLRKFHTHQFMAVGHTTFWENLRRFNLHFMHGVNCNNAIELCKAHKGCMSGPSRHAPFVVVHMS